MINSLANSRFVSAISRDVEPTFEELHMGNAVRFS
jgi:hypothetical protein